MIEKNLYAIIILAAGASSRLGRPKQSLPYGETDLLQHAAGIALRANVSKVIVVINETMDNFSSEEKLVFAVNKDAGKGLSTSIKKGIETLLTFSPSITAAIIMPCDQPFVSTEILDEFIAKHESSGKGIISASYAGTFGTPALFHHTYFNDLLNLKGDMGAKPLMKQHSDDMAHIDFPQGNIDIDTPEDLQNIGIKL